MSHKYAIFGTIRLQATNMAEQQPPTSEQDSWGFSDSDDDNEIDFDSDDSLQDKDYVEQSASDSSSSSKELEVGKIYFVA